MHSKGKWQPQTYFLPFQTDQRTIWKGLSCNHDNKSSWDLNHLKFCISLGFCWWVSCVSLPPCAYSLLHWPVLTELESFLIRFNPFSESSPPFRHLLSLPLPPSHFAFESSVLVVMESLLSLCELLSLMRLLSHTPYRINRLHQPITTPNPPAHGPRRTQRLISPHQRLQFVIDKMWCKQREWGWGQRQW